MGSTTKPLGGIATITLGVASSSGAAPTLPTDGVQIALLEDKSTYCYTATWIGQSKSVQHTITMVTAAQYTLPEQLEEALTLGFVALVVLNSGDQISIGWSDDATSDRALRLVSCSMSSGEKPSSRGYKEWVFETTDSQMNI